MKKVAIAVAFLHLLFTASFNDVCAQDAGKAKELAEGIVNGNNEISHYNTACYFALAGNKMLALAYLRKAVSDGFDQPKVIREDSDLISLHQEAEWTSLVKSVEQNVAKKKAQDGLFFNQPGFWDSKYFQTPYRINISEDEKVAGLSKFWSEAKYNFANFDLVPNINIDSLYFAWLPKVKKTKSTLEYYKVMAEMCAKLNDSHTWINAPAELRDSLLARPVMRTRLIGDKVLVVEADRSLREKGVKEGMEITTVNGLPVKEYAARFITPYLSGSTLQDKNVRSYEYALLGGSLKQPIHLKLKDEKGNVSNQTIFRVKPAARAEKIKYPDVVYKVLPGNITYLAINTFVNDSGSKVFAEKYAEIEKSEAIILDLRNNGGGSTDWSILRYLIDSQVTLNHVYSRQYIPSYRAWQRPQSVWEDYNGIRPRNGQRYSKPVILLISARTFSAAEDFAAAFKVLKRGVILGEATGGSTGQPVGITLPGNLTAIICTKRDQYANGDDFVGKGILPDMVVAPTVSDFRQGIDTQLEAALKELKKIK